ncbi:MAG: hypothetical protein ACRD2G_01725 [Terriglobia bacterium]
MRAEIAEQLTKRAGFKVSVHMLNDWCTPSKPGLRFPLSLARAICEITDSDELSFTAMRDSLREQAELGARVVEQRRLAREVADRAAALGESNRQPRKRGRRSGDKRAK